MAKKQEKIFVLVMGIIVILGLIYVQDKNTLFNQFTDQFTDQFSPLDWNEIEDIQDDRHCQWMPDPGTISSSKVKFTDLVWSPRHDGIHFVCEEVPQIKTHKSRGGRYLHSIYNPKKKVFYHTDGAIRIYDDNDITLRHESHVRNAGKIGKRIKIFKIDGELERNKWCDIVSSFFVWNEDVKTYFGGKKQSV